MTRYRRPQDIRVFSIQDRSARPEAKKPRVVRWRIDGRDFSQAFRTKAEADRLRSRLLVAQQHGEWFDPQDGRPESWLPRGADAQLHVWARRWVAEQWPEWAPRTRNEDVYALSRLIPLTTRRGATPAPADLRRYLRDTLQPGCETNPDHQQERWLSRWVLTLAELDRPTLAEVSTELGVGDNGQALANETVRRYRRVAHSCIRRAVELEQLSADPWPPTPRGQPSQGQSVQERPRRAPAAGSHRGGGDHRRDEESPAREPHIPGDDGSCDYAGLRPSEVVMLRPRALVLPPSGWGRIAVTEADVGWDEPGDPETGSRSAQSLPVSSSCSGGGPRVGASWTTSCCSGRCEATGRRNPTGRGRSSEHALPPGIGASGSTTSDMRAPRP
jgi:hypothetical protein